VRGRNISENKNEKGWWRKMAESGRRERKFKRRYTKGGKERFSLYDVIIVITGGDANKGIPVLPPKN
jgi:hypothetical protein